MKTNIFKKDINIKGYETVYTWKVVYGVDCSMEILTRSRNIEEAIETFKIVMSDKKEDKDISRIELLGCNSYIKRIE